MNALPESILERAQRLADLHKTHRPTYELNEATHLMTEMLHIAVHGETWAQPESPQQVWLDLLYQVWLRRTAEQVALRTGRR